MKVRLAVYDLYEQTLLEIKSFSPRLDLEFKDDEGNFEEYNPNWMYLRCVKHEDDLNYDWSRPDSFPTEKVRIDPMKDKVGDLEEKIAAVLHIPVEDLIIFLRHEHGYNSTTSTEYYNMEWRKPKVIQHVSKFDHGKVLYCERGVHAAQLSTYKWHAEFASEAERITISVNDVANDLEGLLFNIKISLKKTDPMRRLKEEVGKRFNL